jgi:PE family/PPE-SVP subfamily C-terminal region
MGVDGFSHYEEQQMSFLTAIPQELQSAATQLEGIGNALTAQITGSAASTTAVAPAASDQVSALQAGIFSTYGTLYQQIAAEAQAIQQQFISTLGLSSGTYTETEAANAAANGPVQNIIDSINTALGGPVTSITNSAGPFGLSSNAANIGNIGGGNYASAASDLLGLAGGGLLPADTGDAAAAGAADAVSVTSPAGGVGAMGGMGAMGVMPAGGMGGAQMVGKLSVPPTWAGAVPTMPAVTPIQTVGLTSAAPSAGPGGIIPGMPGMAGGGRSSAGFGAPRYGVKPIVMPKAMAV